MLIPNIWTNKKCSKPPTSKHLQCSDHPRCCEIFITCTVALSAEMVVLQHPSTGCIAEGTGPSVILEALKATNYLGRPWNQMESNYPVSATNSMSSCPYCHQHCHPFIQLYSFWMLFFEKAIRVLHLCWPVVSCFNSCASHAFQHLGIWCFTSFGSSQPRRMVSPGKLVPLM